MSNAIANHVTVLLVDDHAVVREGYRALLDRHGGISVVGEAGDADAALALVDVLEPRIVVMDVTLPGQNGIEATRRLLQLKPATRVLIFSMHEEVIFARRALEAGAAGYVAKSSAPYELADAVQTVARGGRYLSSTVARNWALSEAGMSKGSIDSLSARELDVLLLLLQGLSVKDVAQSMGVNSKTVANHQSSIRQKLGAGSALELLRKVNLLGLEKTPR